MFSISSESLWDKISSMKSEQFLSFGSGVNFLSKEWNSFTIAPTPVSEVRKPISCFEFWILIRLKICSMASSFEAFGFRSINSIWGPL